MLSFSVSSILEAVLLVLALSVDSFVASFAYGSNKIKIPICSLLIIDIVCAGITAISLMMGNLLQQFISKEFTTAFSFAVLFLIGLVKLFDSSLKRYIKRKKSFAKELNFHILDLKFLLRVYADSTKADRDESKVLSPKEAIAFAIAVSIDGLAAGFGAGLVNSNVIVVFLSSIILGMASILVGSKLGNRIAEKKNYDLSWLGGALLLVLAFLKIV